MAGALHIRHIPYATNGSRLHELQLQYSSLVNFYLRSHQRRPLIVLLIFMTWNEALHFIKAANNQRDYALSKSMKNYH